MPLVSTLLFPRAHRTPSIMIRGGFFSWPRAGKDAEDDGKLPREISLNTGFDFPFFFFFWFVPRFHPRISFPFLSLSLSPLFLNLFSFVIQRCIIQPSSIVKIIFQFGADWLPFNLTRFHCRTSFICSKYAHLPILLDDFNFIEKKRKKRKKS